MKNQETLNKSLLLAVQMGNLKAVQKALNEGADIDFQGENGQTALMRAILNQKEDVFNLLLFENANVNLQDKEGKTALMMAYQMGLTDFIEELKLKGADEKIKDIYGYTAKDYELEEAVGMPEPVSIEKKKAQKLLMESILIESKEGIDIALKNGADLEYQNFEGEEGTPLLFALKKGNVQIISYLMERGAKANEEMVKIAAKDGNVYALDELTKRGKQFFSPEVKKLLFRSHLSPDMQRIIQEYEESQGTLEGKTEEEIQVAVTQAQEQKQKEEVAKIEAKKEEVKKEQAEKEELQKQEKKKEEEQKQKEEKEQKEAQEEQKEESKNEEKSPVLEVMNTVLALKQAHEVLEIASKTGIKIKEGEEVQLTSTLAAQMMRMAKQKALNEKDETALIQTAGVLLYLAGYQNKADVVRQVFAYYKDFYKHSQYLAEGLAVAAELGHRDVLNEMIIHGADLNPKTGKRPLESAVSGGHEAVVNLLLSKGANVLPLDLDIAGGKGYEKLIDVLWLKTKKDKKALRKALYSAASAGHVKVVEKILKETDKWGAMGYNQVFKPLQTYTASFATTALLGAVRNNHIALAKMLLEKGADAKQDALLYPAVHHKNKELVQILLEKGADMNMPFESTLGKIEPVAEAIRNNDVEIVQLFLENGLNPNKKVYTIGNEMHQLKEIYCSLLMLSAQSGAVDVMNLLIEKGAHINEVNKNKESVLDVFEKNNAFEISNNKKMKEQVDYLRNLGAKTAKEIQEERREKSFMIRLKKALSKN